jgi:hypothetical protein
MDSNGLTQEERDQLEQEEMEEEEQDQMDGAGAQMEEDDEDEGSPEGGNVGQGMSTDDYEEIDYKICGELGKRNDKNTL